MENGGGGDLTGFENPESVANYFDTRTNQGGNLVDNATNDIREALANAGGTIDLYIHDFLLAIKKGKIVSSAYGYNIGKDATTQRTKIGKSIEFTLPYTKDGVSTKCTGYIVLEGPNVNPDGTYKSEIYLQERVGDSPAEGVDTGSALGKNIGTVPGGISPGNRLEL